jgi:hypothetical protein
MPGDGLAHGPPADKKAGGSHHRSSQIIRHSLRDGFNGFLRALPGDRAFLPPSPAARNRKLGLSVGRPGPHDFVVRACHVRLTCQLASTASRPAFVTTRPPLVPRRDGRTIPLIPPSEKQNCFSQQSLTGFLSRRLSGKSAWMLMRALRGNAGPRVDKPQPLSCSFDRQRRTSHDVRLGLPLAIPRWKAPAGYGASCQNNSCDPNRASSQKINPISS